MTAEIPQGPDDGGYGDYNPPNWKAFEEQFDPPHEVKTIWDSPVQPKGFVERGYEPKNFDRTWMKKCDPRQLA